MVTHCESWARGWAALLDASWLGPHTGRCSSSVAGGPGAQKARAACLIPQRPAMPQMSNRDQRAPGGHRWGQQRQGWTGLEETKSPGPLGCEALDPGAGT